MMTSSTSDFTTAPKAAPIITPIARSTTFPLKANFLNSSYSDSAFFRGSNGADGVSGSMGLPSRVILIYCHVRSFLGCAASLGPGVNRPLDAAIGDEPDGRDQGVQGAGDPGVDERHADGDGVEAERQSFLEGAAKRPDQRGVSLVVPQQHVAHDLPGEAAQEHDDPVGDYRPGGELGLAEPAGDEGDEREPKQQMKIGPERQAADVL